MEKSQSPSSRGAGKASRRGFMRLVAGGSFVAFAAPLVAACGGGASGGQSYTVNMTDALKFDPATLTIPKGATVTWKNTSQVVHTSTDDPSKATNAANAVLPSGAQPWNSGDVNPGNSWSHTFDTSGQYTYFCIPHEASGMIGQITVQ